jgi:hypothetical protein
LNDSIRGFLLREEAFFLYDRSVSAVAPGLSGRTPAASPPDLHEQAALCKALSGAAQIFI